LAWKVRAPAGAIQEAAVELPTRESGWDDFGWLLSAAAECICWSVTAGLCRPAAGSICWLFLQRPKAETASIKQRPKAEQKAAAESSYSQHQATAEGRADTESRDRKPTQSAASRAAD